MSSLKPNVPNPFGESKKPKNVDQRTPWGIANEGMDGAIATNADLTPAQKQELQNQRIAAYEESNRAGNTNPLAAFQTVLTARLADNSKEVAGKREAIATQLDMLQGNNAAKLQQKVNSFFGATQALKATNYTSNNPTNGA